MQPEVKPQPKRRVAGERRARLDALAKVTGGTVYATDFGLPGMLHGCLLRSPHPHATIRSIDISKAENLGGVFAVVTAKNTKLNRFGNFIKDFEVFADTRVSYIGQAVAGVAAISKEIAQNALALIEVEYEVLKPVLSTTEAIAPDAPLVWPEWESLKVVSNLKREGNRTGRTLIRVGDVEAGFAESYRVYEHTFTTKRVHPGYTEPRATVGYWHAQGGPTVWCNTQLLFDTQNALGEIFGIPPSSIRVVVPGIGGGFGGKLRLGMEHYALALSRAAKRPVRVVPTSEEEMMSALTRQPARITLKTGVDKDGRLLAMKGLLLVDTGASSGSGPLIASTGTTILSGPYRTLNLYIEGMSAYTNTPPTGSVRAPAGPMPNFAIESQLDIIATDLGIDPLELRLRNIVREGDVCPTGQIAVDVGLEECLLKAAERIGWDTRNPSANRGKGISCGWWMTSRGSSGAYLKLTPDGRVTMIVGVVEIGTGALTGAAQVLAEELGVELNDIDVVSADSACAPYDFGSQGSRTLFAVANAVKIAAGTLKEKMRTIAAQLLKVGVDELTQEGKSFRAGEKTVTFGAISGHSQLNGGGLIAEGTYIAPGVAHDASRVENHMGPAWSSPSFHAHAAEVEVDPATGEITVHRYVVAQDVGYAINPTYLEGQIEGGAVQGMGQAMSEELVYEDGFVLNANLTDYKMPTSMDTPDVEVIMVLHPSPTGPYGAKGVGEPPCMEPPAAIANAVASASGKRIQDLPITAEKIARAK